MLELKIPAKEYFDESTQTFLYTKEQTIRLEHSLLSISKWEAKWCKSFLDTKDKTTEEIIDYVRCMLLTPNEDVVSLLGAKELDAINEYINAPMTATTINRRGPKSNRNSETVTSELIYYWMIALQIPMECQKWHLNRLMMLIEVCSIKNQPGKKMSKNAILKQNSELNKARRAQSGSKG